MKTLDGKNVDVAYDINYVINNSDNQFVILSETRNKLDFAYYSSIAAVRAKYPKAKISLIVDDYGGDMVFTLSRFKDWLITFDLPTRFEFSSIFDKFFDWCKNE